MGWTPVLLLVLAATSGAASVAWPMRRARAASVLARAHWRSVMATLVVGFAAVPGLLLVDASRRRDEALARPVGPGWAPDVGLSDVAQAGALGVLAVLAAGLTVSVVCFVDIVAFVRLRDAANGTGSRTGALDVGLGDAVLERPRPIDYRTDAAADVARGDVALGRRLLRRALVVDAVTLAFLFVAFLAYAGAALALLLF